MKKDATASRPAKAAPASGTAPAGGTSKRVSRSAPRVPVPPVAPAAPEVAVVAAPVEPVATVTPASTAPAPEQVGKKKKKAKVVRDSFTMPESDYAKIAALKKKSLEAGIGIKKSELLRAGLHALEAMPIAKLKALLGGVENIKTGRPAAEQKAVNGESKPAA